MCAWVFKWIDPEVPGTMTVTLGGKSVLLTDDVSQETGNRAEQYRPHPLLYLEWVTAG